MRLSLVCDLADWPSGTLSYEARFEAMVSFFKHAAQAFVEVNESGHPMESGHVFLADRLPLMLEAFNKSHSTEPMPYLAALIVVSAFDVALHDAYRNLHQVDIYVTYNSEYMNHDLTHYFRSSQKADRFQKADSVRLRIRAAISQSACLASCR